VEGPLKERLTGALIVVAVLVIVVPEMLSGPDKPPATGSGGSDAGPPVRTYSLELGTSAAARTQDQSALTPQSAEPAEKPEQPLQAPPAPPPAAQPSQAESAPPAADVKPAPASASTAQKQWWTQLGSFSARNNAERLARELRDKGYSIDIARIRVGNKDLYRVRAGPVASREAAVALQSRLAAAGHKSSLVPP